MAVKTTLEQLEEVQAAITIVMAGQESSFLGTRVAYADLKALESREEKLLARYHIEAGNITTRTYARNAGRG